MHSLIFFGSDQYSAVALSTIIATDSTRKITVVTDHKPGGTEVEKIAKTHDLKVTYYPSNPDEMIKFISLLKSNISNLESNQSPLGLCASFDHLIPTNIIDLFGGNLYNLHPSLLPQYRNVSPVQYAIAMGDTVTGITLFRISSGIDNGEIIAQAEDQIQGEDTTLTLTPRLFKLGANLFLRFLGSDLKGSAQPADTKAGRSDPDGILIFTHRLTRDSGYIEWSVLHKLLDNKSVSPQESQNELLGLRLQKEAETHSHLESRIYLLDLLRALNPWPGIWTTVPTKKGVLRVSLESLSPIMVKLAGKPKPISYSDFTKYYLQI